MVNKLLIKNQNISQDFFFNIEKCPLTYDFKEHSHDFSELVVILGGNGTHIIDGAEYPINKGEVFIINGESIHGYKNVKNLYYINVMFSMEYLLLTNDLKKMPGFQSLFILEPFYRKQDKFKSRLKLSSVELKKIEVLLDIILEEFKLKDDGFKTIIQYYWTAIAILLSRKYYSSNNTSEKILRLGEVISYIETNYLNSVTIEELASKSFMSRRHFMRVFKERFKTTPMKYIIELRLKHAYLLLSNSNNTISNIAFECGFIDSNYFSRQFKHYFGFAPSDYHKSVLKEYTE